MKKTVVILYKRKATTHTVQLLKEEYELVGDSPFNILRFERVKKEK